MIDILDLICSAVTATPQASIEAMQMTLRVFSEGPRELRAISRFSDGRTCARLAYPANAADAMSAVRDELTRCGETDFYIQLNPLSSLPSPARDHLFHFSSRPSGLLIARRRFLLLDIDAARPSGCNASSAELYQAALVSQNAYESLNSSGWPDPIVALSGNGVHLLFAVDLPVDEQSTEITRLALQAIARRFDTAGARIDTVVYDPGRITRLYGTVNCKYSDTAERPRRQSRILKVPPQLTIVSQDKLREIAGEIREVPNTAGHDLPTDESLSIDAFLDRLSGVRRSGNHQDRWVARCPAHADTTPSLSIGTGRDGRILVYCHAGCDLHAILASMGLHARQLFNSNESSIGRVEVESPQEIDPAIQSYADACARNISAWHLGTLANQLGVTCESLQQLAIGWSPEHHAWTIPERRADGRVVGIQLRLSTGAKYMIPGSRRGLILPANWWERAPRIFIPEGPSDVAAFLSAGLSAIGRPSATNPAELVQALMTLPSIEVVVVGENDRKQDGRWPGREGAEQCARMLEAELHRQIQFTLPLEPFKDVREYLNFISRRHS